MLHCFQDEKAESLKVNVWATQVRVQAIVLTKNHIFCLKGKCTKRYSAALLYCCSSLGIYTMSSYSLSLIKRRLLEQEY